MNSIQLKDRLWWVGIEDFDLKVFDIIMTTEYGTSYNSYILKGSEKTALFETEKSKFFDEYLARIEEVAPLADIDYIIMNHTEPDHADGIGLLLEKNPEITVVGTAAAVNNLKQIINRTDFKAKTVRDKETLSLGDITLEFHALPNLHWPDTMWTYAKEIKTLFPCDSFGAHFATEEVLRSKVTDEEGYWKAAKYYYDCIMGPFSRPFVRNGLLRLKDLDVDMICTGHGPVLDSHIDEIIAKTDEWSAARPFARPTVVIPYVTAYGYTEMIARAIAEGLVESADGNMDVLLHNMQEDDPAVVIDEINRADGVLFGSPTIVGEALPPIFNLTTGLHAALVKGKHAAAFGSFGWSGEAVPHLTERLKQLNMKVHDGLRIRFKPSEADLREAKAYGEYFGHLVRGTVSDSAE